jgi:hypothetical protein
MRALSLSTFAVASLFAAATVACTEEPATEEDLSAALELENGGLDTTDETPMFGADAEFASAQLENDATATDPLAADAEVAQLRERPDVGRQRVMILWGQLPPDRAAAAHVWDGRFALNRGALIVRRTVGFEERTDAVLPREVRTTVAFTSTTQPFVDGLVLEVLDPTPTDPTPLAITYTPRAGGAPLVFRVRALAEGPIAYDVGTAGDQMVATGVRADDACDHGFMRGRWHALRPNLGRFLGVVADEDGEPLGHLRGLWGVRRSGEHAMFAKYIALDGAFRGIFAGTWGEGAFRGRWIISTGDHGLAQGRYREGIPGPETGGAFVGRWAETSCAAGL